MTTSALKAAAKGELPAKEARNPYEALKHQLEISRGEFAKLVGSTANADKFIRVVLNAVLANPALIDVSRSSLVASCMRAAQDGLMPDGREAVLNIYSTKVKQRGGPDQWEQRAQYLPMVGGLIKKLYAGGDVTYVDATVVYRGDVFKFQRGDEPRLIHEPALEYAEGSLVGGDPVIVAAYCVVKLKNGETKREVMTRHDIDKVRAASKSADSGPWKTWFSEMAIKSVIKRIYKQLPHSDAFDEIEKYDNEAMGYTGLGESAAVIAQRTLNDQPTSGQQALTDNPSEVLDQQTLGDGAERRVEERVEQIRGAQQEVAAAAEALGVVTDADKALATEIEVKMRAAKSRDEVSLQADRARAIKDEALALRLDEIYEAELSRFAP
jgi:recombination protein RecT